VPGTGSIFVCNSHLRCGPNQSQIQRSFGLVSNCGKISVTIPIQGQCCPVEN
jgi:hypothetical protein